MFIHPAGALSYHKSPQPGLLFQDTALHIAQQSRAQYWPSREFLPPFFRWLRLLSILIDQGPCFNILNMFWVLTFCRQERASRSGVMAERDGLGHCVWV